MLRAVSYLTTVGRIVAREVRSRGRPRWLPDQRLAVERRNLRPGEKRLLAYLAATGAPARGMDGPLPPLFGAVWEAGLALELLAQPGAPSVRHGVVHLESEVLFVRPLAAADAARCRLQLDAVEAHPRGRLLWLHARIWNQAGQLCSESRTALLVRGADRRQGGRGSGARRDERLTDPEPGEWLEVERWRLGAGEGRRYAAVSGDYNPIHLWAITARPFGFRRPILHGFCTAARAAHALLARYGGGDPSAVKRFRIAFRKPLLLPATARLLVRSSHATAGAADAVRFRVAGEDDQLHAEGEIGGRLDGQPGAASGC